jgi:pyruvate/2-oxoglutarate dehydrogenase complex dihydrolipoamide acyltransferase (E2) component
MPALSSTMTEGKIVSWLKSPGDKITKGEAVVVVESDKADMDVEAFTAGFLGGIVIAEGGVASVGEPIAYVAETESELEEAKAKASSGNGAAPAAAAAAPAPAAAPEPVKVTRNRAIHSALGQNAANWQLCNRKACYTLLAARLRNLYDKFMPLNAWVCL